MQSILLIDDKPDQLAELANALKEKLPAGEVEIREWVPTRDEADSFASFNQRVDEETALVVTDYDLSPGTIGLFGSSIVNWCQARAIPVGDYSRGNTGMLPKEPNLFELRVPSNAEAAAPYIATIFRGFKAIKEQLSANADRLKEKRSPAAVLSDLLGVPDIETQLALYSIRLSTTNAALLELITKTAPEDLAPTTLEKQRLLGYILGHTLLNAILRFPGPILSQRALVAYAGCAESEASAITEFFKEASYTGPFSDLDSFFWLFKVDEILRPLIGQLPSDFQAETPGERNREAIELKLQRKLSRHSCPRCNGINGGFLCPFTQRTVCQRADCSVGSNSWVPQGAKLCRIERDFYDEWAPILGI